MLGKTQQIWSLGYDRWQKLFCFPWIYPYNAGWYVSNYYVMQRNCYVMPRNCYVMPRNCYVMPRNCYVMPRKYYVMPRHYYVMPRNCYVMPRNCYAMPRKYYVMPRHCCVMPCAYVINALLLPIILILFLPSRIKMLMGFERGGTGWK